MVDSAAEKDGATPSVATPSSSEDGAASSAEPDAPSSASPDPKADTLTDETVTTPDAESSAPVSDREDDDIETASEAGSSDESGADESGAHESGARESGAHESGAHESGAHESGAHESGADESGARASQGDDAGTEVESPPGELAPAESDVPPPPKPSARRIAAKTVSLDNPPDPLSEMATEKRHAARRADSDSDVDSGWGNAPPSPGLPPRPRGARPRPPSSVSAPSSTSPASLGLGARPSKRPVHKPSDDDAEATADEPTADEPPTTEASRPVLTADATNTNVVPHQPGDADATAALSAQGPAPSLPIAAALPPTEAAAAPTAPALHAEDEDDPTIVNYPQAAGDDEKTTVHPSRGPFVPPIADPAAVAAELEMSPPTAELPPELTGLDDAFASREAAVQAALAAATERPSLTGRSPAKEQQIVVAIATLLGVGMVLGAIGAYLTARAVAAGDSSAGASLAGANVVCCISLFAAGFASLQPKQKARIGLIIASASMLVIDFIWMLAAAF